MLIDNYDTMMKQIKIFIILIYDHEFHEDKVKKIALFVICLYITNIKKKVFPGYKQLLKYNQ